jgi:hypothetical protein
VSECREKIQKDDSESRGKKKKNQKKIKKSKNSTTPSLSGKDTKSAT